MKSALSLLLCLLLLTAALFSLAGCGDNAVPETPTEPLTDMPTETQPVTAAPQSGGQAEFHLDELPDIGEYASDEKVQYFFEDGPRDTFEPRTDYGRVIPYIARAKYYTTPKFYSYVDEETGETVTYENEWSESMIFSDYGLMTADGRIITKGLWNSVTVQTFPDGSGYIMLICEDPARDGEGTTEYIGLDGSWKLTAEEFEYYGWGLHTQPYLYLFENDKLLIYNTAGQKITELRDESTNEYRSIYDFQLLYEDEEKLIFNNSFYPGYDGPEKNVVTTVSHTGKVLHRFETTGGVRNFGGSVLFLRKNYEAPYTPVDPDGKPLNDKTFTNVFFSEKLQLYLAIQGHEALYYDAGFNPVQVKDTAWQQSFLLSPDNYSAYEGPQQTVLTRWDGNVAYDFYGGTVKYPAEQNEISQLETVYDNEGKTEYMYAYLKDGRVLLCTVDGTLIAETPKDQEKAAKSELSTTARSVSNGTLFYITSDHELHAVDIQTGEEHSVHLDFLDEADKRVKKAENRYTYVPQGDINTAFIHDYMNWNDYSETYENAAVYSPTGRIRTIKNVISAARFDGYWSVYANSGCYVYAPDGKLLIKMNNNENV